MDKQTCKQCRFYTAWSTSLLKNRGRGSCDHPQPVRLTTAEGKTCRLWVNVQGETKGDDE